ncbi:MAG: hypothetical protein GY805_39155 [Chloroflexi bacterium]|nr:hypothetical protein [Chloroflexota bacterium]
MGSISGLDSVLHAHSQEESQNILQTQKVDVMIIDYADEANNKEMHHETVFHLLQQSNLRVITISLASGDMWIYRQEKVVAASVEDLAIALVD